MAALHDKPITTPNIDGGRRSLDQAALGFVNRSWAIGQATKHQATISLWERDIKNRKLQFGTKLYDSMKVSQVMGRNKKNGPLEEFREVDAIFRHCESDIRRLQELRTEKQSELTKANNPKALCYQNPGESPSEKTRTPPQRAASTGSVNFFQRNFQLGLQKARDSVQSASAIAKLKTELLSLDRQMEQRKQAFGIEMYDTLVRVNYDSKLRDPVISGLFAAAKKDIAALSEKIEQAELELSGARQTGGMLVPDDEIRDFILSNPSLWAMLEVNIGYPSEQCQEIAFRVAIELMSGKTGIALTKAQVTKRQFRRFEKFYLNDPKGSQEFFHRCVFSAFDADGNGVLDKEEIDRFLDTFYTTGSIFQGDARLPEKDELKRTIMESLDENGDGVFTFDEIRTVITGKHAHSNN